MRTTRRTKTARTEQAVRLAVIAEAKRLGVPHERNHKGPGAETGWPDDKFYIPGGKPWLVEFKAPGKFVEPGSRQDFILSMLKRIGYDATECNDEKHGIAELRRRASEASYVFDEATFPAETDTDK